MSTLSVVDETQTATLLPGHYWIEMAFDRPTSTEIFLRALRTIGFDSVGLELEEPTPVKISGVAVSSSPASVSTGPSSYARVAITAAPSVIQSAARVPTGVTATATAAPTPTQARPLAPTGIHDASSATPAPAPAPAGLAPRATAARTGPSAVQAAALYTEPSRVRHMGELGGAGTGDGGDAGAPPPGGGVEPGPGDQGEGGSAGFIDDQYGPPGPDQGRLGPTREGGGGGGSPWEGDNVPAGVPGGKITRSYQLPPGSLPALPVAGAPPVPGAVSVHAGVTPMWICPPGTKWTDVKISGRRGLIVGGVASPGTTFRFVGQLGAAIDIKSLPGLRWTIIHSVAFDPWASMTFRLTPHDLKRGQMYDLRFLSRDKTAKSKIDVLALLEAMGFKPATLFLSKRNMRIPGRPLTTLSEWFGVGIWTGPDSVIVSSDPFYFAEVRPTS
jgi:hypothetical protein